MKSEQQYIDLFTQCEAMICRHSADVLNAPRAKAFADFERLGFLPRSRRSISIRKLENTLLLIMA